MAHSAIIQFLNLAVQIALFLILLTLNVTDKMLWTKDVRFVIIKVSAAILKFLLNLILLPQSSPLTLYYAITDN